jgi:hypothetical protein
MVRVAAGGGFEGEEPTVSTGITYQVAVTGEASEEHLRALVSEVDRIASIPDVFRRESTVSLSDVKIDTTRQAPGAGETARSVDNPPTPEETLPPVIRPLNHRGP